MGLSIKNAEVELMIRNLAARRGAAMTEALRQLLIEEEARAVAARAAEIETTVAAVHDIQKRFAAIPDVGEMTDTEILGYDRDGIPSR
jgi:hypothetical protein